MVSPKDTGPVLQWSESLGGDMVWLEHFDSPGEQQQLASIPPGGPLLSLSLSLAGHHSDQQCEIDVG